MQAETLHELVCGNQYRIQELKLKGTFEAAPIGSKQMAHVGTISVNSREEGEGWAVLSYHPVFLGMQLDEKCVEMLDLSNIEMRKSNAERARIDPANGRRGDIDRTSVGRQVQDQRIVNAGGERAI